MDLIKILKKILAREVYFHFVKSSGHGGQNVNKRKTKAELYFNVANSCFLTEEQKQQIIDRSGHRIHHHEKILIMTCHEERYQRANKKKVIHHFRQFMEEALKVEKKRIVTKVPAHEKEKRLTHKQRQSVKKKSRKQIDVNKEL